MAIHVAVVCCYANCYGFYDVVYSHTTSKGEEQATQPQFAIKPCTVLGRAAYYFYIYGQPNMLQQIVMIQAALPSTLTSPKPTLVSWDQVKRRHQ